MVRKIPAMVAETNGSTDRRTNKTDEGYGGKKGVSWRPTAAVRLNISSDCRTRSCVVTKWGCG